jgi:hypothetical protein
MIEEPSTQGPVESIMRDVSAIEDFFRERQEISFLSVMEATAPKVLLLAAASYLEYLTQRILLEYFKLATNGNEHAIEFVKNKAIERQYHSYFDWTSRNANKFFGLFGQKRKAQILRQIAEDDKLASAISSYLELGGLRNQLVHRNYGAFVLDKTVQDIFHLYESALYFLHRLPSLLLDEAHDS